MKSIVRVKRGIEKRMEKGRKRVKREGRGRSE